MRNTRHRSILKGACAAFSVCVCVGMLLTGCMDEEFPGGSGDSGCFTVLSEERAMLPASRSAAFQEGTKYALWVISDNNWSQPYVENRSIGSDGNGELDRTSPNNFMGMLDFYSLTWGTDVAPAYGKSGGIPMFSHKRNADGTLPDLRRAVRRGCTAANTGGKVVLPFEHTLVKLRYEVVRQSEESLKGARITDITVHDHKEGTLNVSTGEYAYSGGDMAVPVLPESLGGIDVPETMTEVKGVETLVFPNLPGEYLTVSVTVQTPERTFTTDYKIPTAAIEGGQIVEKPFRFLPNHEYVLQLTVMTDRVRIVAIVPQKYDWIDETDNNQPVGNPVVFAGAMWLDRNLGALGYDITDSETFDKSVGFFYQTCRNIPYWPFCWSYRTKHYADGRPTAKDRYAVNLSSPDGSVIWSTSTYRPYPIVSDRLAPYLNVKDDGVNDSYGWCDPHRNRSAYRAYMIFEPEEAEEQPNHGYAFAGAGSVAWWSGNEPKKIVNYAGKEIDYAQYWNDPDDQPTPAGWAIPTADQFRSIFPITPFAGNIACLNGGNNSDPSNWNPNGITSFGEDIDVMRVCVPYWKNSGVPHKQFWEEFDRKTVGASVGWFPESGDYRQGYRPEDAKNADKEPDGDPAPGYYSVYVISRAEGDALDLSAYPVVDNNDWKVKEVGTIYAIKKAGTAEAYRMRWKVFDAAEKDGKHPLLYVQVNIYTCGPNDNLTHENFSEFDWDHPTASMNFPLSGLIDGKPRNNTNMFCNYGSEVMYATSTVNGIYNTVLRMKLWGGDNARNVYIAIVEELVNHGKQIRMIRE